MKEPLTLVQLTPYEAQSFIAFQKHRALIGFLESIKAFDLRDASLTLHFNSLGEIKTVDKHEFYRV